MTANFKRGFNRLYLVLVVMWVVYCLFVYPQQKQVEAFTEWQSDQKLCYASHSSVEDENNCLRTMEDNYQNRRSMYSGREFYLGVGWIWLLLLIVFPLMLYGFCHGAVAVVVWVWRGFRVPAQN
jgi:preprotein translocase subunit Sec63